jgi:tripartite motif-containing protein 71
MTLSQMLKVMFRRCAVFSVLNRKPVGLAIAISLVWIIIGGSVASGETFLRTWGSFGSGDGQFNSPFGVAVQGEEVFVVDFNHRVQVFKRDGTFLRTWGSFGPGNGQFMFPIGVAVQERGGVKEGEMRGKEEEEERGEEIEREGRGNEVFVTDAGTPPIGHRVQVFDRRGTFLRTWGSFGSGDGQFMFPVGVAVQGDEVYVADSANFRVQVFDRNGTFLRKFGSFGSGDGQFNGPVGIAVQGNEVFVTDELNHRVEVFDRNGTFLRTWGSFGLEDGQFLFTGGVAVQGNEVYVVDYNDQNFPESLGNRVQVFDRNGTFLRKFGSFGSGDGQFNGPFGVAVEGSKVFVVDRFNNRVQVFVRH